MRTFDRQLIMPSVLVVLVAAGVLGATPSLASTPHRSSTTSTTSRERATHGRRPSERRGAHQPTGRRSSTPLGTPATGAGLWTTYGRDAARSGLDPLEPPPTNVQMAWRTLLDGPVYGEPLVNNGQVLAATENDTVYSISAETGHITWSAHLGSPVPASALPCGDVSPEGITSTPVIDLAHHRVWVSAEMEPGVHEVVALSVATGQIVSRQTIAMPSGVDPLAMQQRSGLALAQNHVYVAFGGLYGDCGNYRGLVVSVPTKDSGQQRSYVVPTARQGGIWAPPGPVVTDGPIVYVTTGNGASTTSYDQGDSVLALSGNLDLMDWFAPADWKALNADDLDLGSVSPTLVDRHFLFQVGKAPDGYLLERRHLGHIDGQIFQSPVCPQGAFGGTSVSSPLVFVPCHNRLTAVSVAPSGTFRTVWSDPDVHSACSVLAGGTLWTVTTSGSLLGLDPATGATTVNLSIGGDVMTSFPSLATASSMLFAPSGPAVTAFSGI